jgi:hypothetical protein
MASFEAYGFISAVARLSTPTPADGDIDTKKGEGGCEDGGSQIRDGRGGCQQPSYVSSV